MASRMSGKWYVMRARRLYQRDGEVEIDEKAPVSTNDTPDADHGAYVQGWVWVEDPEPARRRPQ